jgi:signal transduction histidine kinase
MTNTPPLDSRRAAFGQALIPLALLALVGLVGGLVFHARSLEARHRVTAESALRDYAALAAWQYAQQAENYIGSSAHTTLMVVQPFLHRLVSTSRLPDPDTLVKFGNANACGIGSDARFSFRLDLPSRKLTFAGSPPDSAARVALASRFAALAGHAPLAKEMIRMFVDTVGGAPRAIAYGVVRGLDSVPRAVYGIEASPSTFVSYLRGIPKSKPLLPPSLVHGQPLDSVLMVEVRRADGGILTTLGSASNGAAHLSAEDTTSAQAGRLVTRVVLRPETAGLLLIGGLPSSHLDTLLMLLAGSIVLAGIALLQIRRGRELARLRTRFVANVSHELRTPLAQISMFSETLLLGRERSREEGQEFLSIIFREARRLSHLVETVLRFSRTEADVEARDLRLEPNDVAREARDAVRAFAPLAAASGVELRTHGDDGCIALIAPDALRQVLLNLLDNAVKFGPAGQRIEVRVACDGEQVLISVTDEGPGIPESERRSVFEPFTQVASSQSRTTTGAGIGLAVVADLVAAHGGRVWIDDAPGLRGTRVSIALPAVMPAAPPPTDHAFEPDEVLAAQ